MEYNRLLRDSFSTVLDNLPVYGPATLILTFGSILLITAPPLIYGFVLMLSKGARQEDVKIADVFEGFRPANFLRSWIYAILMFAIIILFFIIWAVLYVVLGLSIVAVLTLAGVILPEIVIIILMVVISILMACIVSIPAIFILFVLPLFVIKKYSITDALSESIGLVKENLVASTVLCVIVALIALAGVAPYYAGMFLQWPVALNLSIYVIGILLTMPLSQQILVNATFDLMGEEIPDIQAFR